MLARVPGRADIALVSLGTTMGLREADAAFASLVRAAGASCEVVPVRFGATVALRRRSMALIDLVEALSARHTAAGVRAGAIVYSTVTAALLRPAHDVPVAVRFDGTAGLNRPGRGGVWQRRRERHALADAALLLPWSTPAQAAAADAAGAGVPPSIVFPPPLPAVEAARHVPADAPDAIAYAANPDKRGLELLCEAWARARPGAATLAIGGIEREAGLRWLARSGVAEPPGIVWLGRVEREHWLGLVASAGVFVSAARIEDWGLAQMEALAVGTPLVATPAPGANASLPLARRLAPALVAAQRSAPSLADALRAGLALDAGERAAYAASAAELLEPFGEAALRRRMADEILPRLLSSSV
jgi:glycosyltransferase involved in cell wall biosynthesis